MFFRAAVPQVREHVVDVSSITRKRQIVLFRSAVSQVKESMLFRSAESQRERMHVIQIRNIISESVSQAKEKERERACCSSQCTKWRAHAVHVSASTGVSMLFKSHVRSAREGMLLMSEHQRRVDVSKH